MSEYQVVRVFESGPGQHGWDSLYDALECARSLGGMVANLVQIVEHPECLYDGKPLSTPLSEEIVGIDKLGRFAPAGELLVLTIHGLGVLEPDLMRQAQAVGYVGNDSANLDRLFPDQDVFSMILNRGRLPGGRRIAIIPYAEYKESGLDDSGVLHGVVRTREEATYSDFGDIAALSDNPQIITYCGGRRRAANLFDAWKRRGQRAFHTRNVLFRGSRAFVDAEQKHLVATMANPLWGPADGFFGNWPLSNLDKCRLRYLIVRP